MLFYFRSRPLMAVLAASVLIATPLAAQDSAPASSPASSAPAKTEEGYIKAHLPVKPATAPKHIKVQHILIGFEGSVRGKEILRSKEEAEKLAREVLKMAWKGVEFDSLVSMWTDDAFPGIYSMANKGEKADKKIREFQREQMVPAFGDVGFNIHVGQMNIAPYDPKTSPYGWHIIKRLE